MQPYYTLLVSDLDGTLLNSKNQITRQTKQVIARYREAGGHFTIATGRTLMESRAYIRELQIDLPVILGNGTMLYFPQTNEVQVMKTLSHHIVDQLLAQILHSSQPSSLLIFSAKHIYSFFISDKKARELQQNGIQTIPVHSLTQVTEKMTKLQMIGSPKDGELLRSIVEKQPFNQACDFVESHINYFEIVPKDVSKGSTLKHVLQLLDIPVIKTAAIGDQCNDIDLLRLSGLSAVVANAHPRVKQYATYHVPTNDQDGVAYLIEECILK